MFRSLIATPVAAEWALIALILRRFALRQMDGEGTV